MIEDIDVPQLPMPTYPYFRHSERACAVHCSDGNYAVALCCAENFGSDIKLFGMHISIGIRPTKDFKPCDFIRFPLLSEIQEILEHYCERPDLCFENAHKSANLVHFYEKEPKK